MMMRAMSGCRPNANDRFWRRPDTSQLIVQVARKRMRRTTALGGWDADVGSDGRRPASDG